MAVLEDVASPCKSNRRASSEQWLCGLGVAADGLIEDVQLLFGLADVAVCPRLVVECTFDKRAQVGVIAVSLEDPVPRSQRLVDSTAVSENGALSRALRRHTSEASGRSPWQSAG